MTKTGVSLIKKTIPPNLESAHIGVIGGGISGLTFAYFLAKLRPKWDIKVYEKSERPGGFIRSQQTKVEDSPNTVFEKGPRTLRGVSEGTLILFDLLDKFNLRHSILGIHHNSPANAKYLLSPAKDSHLVQVPNTFPTLMKFLKDPIGRKIPMCLGSEFFTMRRAKSEETVQQFFTRHFGSVMFTNIVSAIMNGIYASNGTQLSIDAVMPKLPEIEAKNSSLCRYIVKKAFFSKHEEPKSPTLSPSLLKYTSLFHPSFNLLSMSQFLKSFPMTLLQGGLETLPKAIARNLPKNVQVVYHSNIDAIEIASNGKMVVREGGKSETFDHLRSTINIHKLTDMLHDPELESIGSNLKYSTVMLANVYVPKKNILPVTGFGFLVPEVSSDNAKLLGLIFDSDVEQHATPLFTDRVTKALSQEQQPEKETLQKLANEIQSTKSPVTRPYTKLTFMLGGAKYGDGTNLPTDNAVKEIVKRKLGDVFGIESFDNYQIEIGSVHDAIPQLNVGYNDLKSKAWDLANNKYQSKLSFGGMTFGDGIGVPDCVMSSFKDALKLSGNE